jgi:hypothetical protein
MIDPTGMCTPDPWYMSWMPYLPVLDMPSTNTHVQWCMPISDPGESLKQTRLSCSDARPSTDPILLRWTACVTYLTTAMSRNLIQLFSKAGKLNGFVQARACRNIVGMSGLSSLRFCFQAHGCAMGPSMRGLNTWVQSKHMLWIDHLSLLLIVLLKIRSGAPS